MALSRVTSCTADEYEAVQVPQRRIVTWGVDIASLANWLDEEATGQRRLGL
jgi:hypothetical protein